MKHKLPRIPKFVENNDGVKVPVFIKIGITEMRYVKDDDSYHRDAGYWSLNYKIKDGKLYADEQTIQHLHGEELKQITKKEWVEGNKGYLPSDIDIKLDLKILPTTCLCCGQELR